MPWDVRAKQTGVSRLPESRDPGAPVERARQLRRLSGDAERKFWNRTRDRRLGGFKFRRQVPIGSYIADFVCATARLVIEIDGDQHAQAEVYDAARTFDLERRGFRVIRFPTHAVLHEIQQVLAEVHIAIEEQLENLRPR